MTIFKLLLNMQHIRACDSHLLVIRSRVFQVSEIATVIARDGETL